MAKIEFKGIVERTLGSKGIKVVESHRKKNESGEWETAGRTYFTVWVNELNQPAEGSLVEIEGVQKTVAEEYQGQTRYNLHVSATKIFVTGMLNRPGTPAPAEAIPDEEVPF
jgi:hypothetical protein